MFSQFLEIFEYEWFLSALICGLIDCFKSTVHFHLSDFKCL